MFDGRSVDAQPSLGRNGAPLFLGSILALTVLIFLPGVVPSLSGDDFVHVYRNQAPPGEWHRYFLEADGREYRPLVRLSLALDHLVWGANYRGFHLTNLALHLAASLLVFLWVRAIFASGPALAATALFAFHPVHSYSVNAVMGRTDILCLVFVLASLVAFERGRRMAPAILFAAALLSKEIAVVVPLLPALRLALFPEARCRRRWWSLAILSGVALVYLSARFSLFAPESADLAVYLQVSVRGLLSNLLHYAGGLILPAGGFFLRDLVESQPPATLILGLGLAVLLTALGAVMLVRRGLPPRISLLALGWIPITLLPVIFLFQRRFLYIPSVGFCLLVAWLVTHRPSRALSAAGLLLGAAYAAGSLSASLEWHRASQLTQAALPGMAAKVAAEPSARFSVVNVPHGVGEAHLFTHDSLRYALALETGFLPELDSITRIQRGPRGSWAVAIVPGGVLTRITPGPQDYFVFDVPELLPRGGRFLPVGTTVQKGDFRISVAETDAGGRPSGLLVSWDAPPEEGRLVLFQPSGETEYIPLEESGRNLDAREGEARPE